jgi:hypothetical protein
VWVDVLGVVHAVSCPGPSFQSVVVPAGVPSSSVSSLPLAEVLQSPVGACCAAVDEVWEDMFVDELLIADRLLSYPLPLRNWFDDVAVKFRADWQRWELAAEVWVPTSGWWPPGECARRVAGSVLAEQLAGLPDVACREFADRLRLQQVAVGALMVGCGFLRAAVPPGLVVDGWAADGWDADADWMLSWKKLCAAGAVNEAVCAADVVAVLEQQVAVMVAAGGSVSGVAAAVACAVEVFEAPPVWLFVPSKVYAETGLVWPSVTADVTTVVWAPFAAALLNGSSSKVVVPSPVSDCPSVEQMRTAALLAGDLDWDEGRMVSVVATALLLTPAG